MTTFPQCISQSELLEIRMFTNPEKILFAVRDFVVIQGAVSNDGSGVAREFPQKVGHISPQPDQAREGLPK